MDNRHANMINKARKMKPPLCLTAHLSQPISTTPFLVPVEILYLFYARKSGSRHLTYTPRAGSSAYYASSPRSPANCNIALSTEQASCWRTGVAYAFSVVYMLTPVKLSIQRRI
jgi:hypothetical protein